METGFLHSAMVAQGGACSLGRFLKGRYLSLWRQDFMPCAIVTQGGVCSLEGFWKGRCLSLCEDGGGGVHSF